MVTLIMTLLTNNSKVSEQYSNAWLLRYIMIKDWDMGHHA